MVPEQGLPYMMPTPGQTRGEVNEVISTLGNPWLQRGLCGHSVSPDPLAPRGFQSHTSPSEPAFSPEPRPGPGSEWTAGITGSLWRTPASSFSRSAPAASLKNPPWNPLRPEDTHRTSTHSFSNTPTPTPVTSPAFFKVRDVNRSKNNSEKKREIAHAFWYSKLV